MESHELYRKFREAARLMRPHPHGGPHGGPHGPAADPTRGQGRILAALKLQDGIATKDLAFILGMRVASLNEALVKLEKTELITREPADDDKRVILIRLTEAGRATEQLVPERPDAFSSL
ncbi:MarR family transcriptional regulator, partial [Gulosibacter sediminis]